MTSGDYTVESTWVPREVSQTPQTKSKGGVSRGDPEERKTPETGDTHPHRVTGYHLSLPGWLGSPWGSPGKPLE